MQTLKLTSKYMPNNWLKNHGYPMRRKPYGKRKLKKEYIIFDEFRNLPIPILLRNPRYEELICW